MEELNEYLSLRQTIEWLPFQSNKIAHLGDARTLTSRYHSLQLQYRERSRNLDKPNKGSWRKPNGGESVEKHRGSYNGRTVMSYILFGLVHLLVLAAIVGMIVFLVYVILGN